MLIYVIIYHKQLVFCFYKDFTKKNFEKLVLNQEIIQDNNSHVLYHVDWCSC